MFKLATTSFILPDTRINNAVFLQNIVDEVELLYFESKIDEDIPDALEIKALQLLDLSYNIHMPIDGNLTLREEWTKLFSYADILHSLQPSTYTFHPLSSDQQQDHPNFVDHLIQFSERFPNVSLENVHGDLSIFKTLENSPIHYCLDIGHALLYHIDPYDFLSKWGNQISHIHCHGVSSGKDHHSFSHLDKHLLTDIVQFAHDYNKTFCIEVFGKSNFDNSMTILRSICEQKNYTDYRWCR